LVWLATTKINSKQGQKLCASQQLYSIKLQVNVRHFINYYAIKAFDVNISQVRKLGQTKSTEVWKMHKTFGKPSETFGKPSETFGKPSEAFGIEDTIRSQTPSYKLD
jgi:hypothetical protein